MKRIGITLNLILIILSNTDAQQKVKLTSATFGAMEARHIGPAVTGGRITAIDVVNSDPRTMYVGTAAGGVWKSITGGTLFKAIFDKYTQSVGEIRISQKNPKTVWVGTGESNMRNSVSVGTGIYKTTDAGDNWQFMGLDSTEHISKIAIDPGNDDVVYVAAPGPLWSDSKHRGLYKTTDGGKTWDKIFYVNEKTGCADVAVDPKNPNVVYASMWQFRRKAWGFESGGAGSGLFKSTDAGKTWKKIQNGFDTQELGRVCIAIAPSEPNNLYAIAEAKKTALYQSTDGGETWTKNSSANDNVTSRPFYFSVIMVDPTDPKRIYRPAGSLSISEDGGKSFTEASQAGGWIHSDHHALWINPNNPNQLFLGTDGGIYMSLDKGNNWLFINNIPVAQFYHVAYDLEQPYNVYGGLQDNGSWMGPSQSPNGIENRDWENVGGGDGFWVQPDLIDKNIVYSESQGGNITRMNRKTNEFKDIQPYPLAGEKKLRWNWNTPLVSSPNDKSVLYCGAQYLYRTRDKGDSWERISPDLTTNDPNKQKQEESGGVTVDNSSAENHCTIFTVAEAYKDPNMIWVGTDDGNLQLTTDAGKTWINLTKSITGLPANTWCSSIEPSHFDMNTVYVTFDGHASGDMKPYIFKSIDMGKTWKNIATTDVKGFCHRIKEDQINFKLLFAGTEMGLFVSIDGGDSWVQYTAKVPNTPVRDIQIHPVTHDLILATHGRGILIVDDITPIRNLTPEILESDAYILPNRPAFCTNGQFGGGFPGAGGFVGPNSTEEAVITYYLKDRAVTGEVKLEFYDQSGNLISTVQGTKRKGINKVTWEMRMKPPRVAQGVRLDFGGFFGPLVQEGMYNIKLIKGDKTYTGKIELAALPWTTHSKADRDLRYQKSMEIYKMEEDLAFMVAQLLSVRDSAKTKMETAKANKTLSKSLNDYINKLEKLRADMVAVKEGTGITGEEKIREKLSGLFYGVASYDGKPTQSHLDRMTGLKKDIDDAQKTLTSLITTDLDKVNTALQKSNMSKIVSLTKEAFDKMDTRGGVKAEKGETGLED